MTIEELAALFALAAELANSEAARQVQERCGATVWGALSGRGLIDRHLSEQAIWQLSARGQAFIDHVLALPLPEEVRAWRMPKTNARRSAPRMTATEVLERQRPPPAPVAPQVEIPTDPAELSALASHLMDSGYGMNEVKETLKLSDEQAQRIFYGGTH